jgi:hypothetical protein
MIDKYTLFDDTELYKETLYDSMPVSRAICTINKHLHEWSDTIESVDTYYKENDNLMALGSRDYCITALDTLAKILSRLDKSFDKAIELNCIFNKQYKNRSDDV